MKLTQIAALIVVASVPVIASAQNVGAGSMTCAKYTTLRPVLDRPVFNAVTSWTHGYITAINVARANEHRQSVRFADQQQVETYTRKYCSEHPLKNILDATQTMVSELSAETEGH